MALIRSHPHGEENEWGISWNEGLKIISLCLICDYKRLFAKEWRQANLHKFDETGYNEDISSDPESL